MIYLLNLLALLFRKKLKVDYLLNFLTSFGLKIGKRATHIWFVLVLITLLRSYLGNGKKLGTFAKPPLRLSYFTEKKTISVSLIEKKKSLKTRCGFLMKYLLEIGFKSLIC